MDAATVNYVCFTTVLRTPEGDYNKRPWLFNELADNLSFRLVCNVKRVSDVNTDKYVELSSDVEVVNLFDDTSLRDLLLGFRRYQEELKERTEPSEDVYFLPQSAGKRQMLLSILLRDCDRCFWVKSEFTETFGEFVEPAILRRALKPIKPLVKRFFPTFFAWHTADCPVFYTGDITQQTENHLRQYPMTSVSRLNRDNSRVSRTQTGNLIYVGDTSRLKGLDILLDALEQLDSTIELTILGTDQVQVRSPELADRVNVVGEIYEESKFFDTLAEHDILVLPSRYDKQAKVHLEAMSAGVVPVCADVGGVYTVVQNLYNGLLFEKENSTQLANCIQFLYDNEAIYNRLLTRGLETAAKHSLEAQAKFIADVITHYYGEADASSLYSQAE